MLSALHIKDVGPAAQLDLEFGERLNILTGDNGLGKSFVLEVAWWALTGTWVGRPMLPQRGKVESAELIPEIVWGGEKTSFERPKFIRLVQDWTSSVPRDLASTFTLWNDVTGPVWLEVAFPVLYVRTNGGFAIWDPARNHQTQANVSPPQIVGVPAFIFNEPDVWDGLKQNEELVCNGLIADWVTWQLEAQTEENHPFHLLTKILARLSHPDEPMTPGKPARPYLNDARRLPTIELPYETTPVVHASAGIKRIVSLTYLLTWMWSEHIRACSMLGWKPAERIVILFEEPETHLHPKWQRHIVPALLDVLVSLSPTMRPQLLVTTHAPLVLASLEPLFDEEKDKLFHFGVDRREVRVEEVLWAKQGDAAGWLMSDVFSMSRGGYSREAEEAINAAYDFMAGKLDLLPEGLRSADAIDAKLRAYLPPDDPLLPSWRFHRRSNG